MNSFKLSDYNLTKSQFCISPIFNIIAKRHLAEIKNQSTWQGKAVHLIIGMIEFIPIVGFIFSIGEAYVAQKRQSSLQLSAPVVPSSVQQKPAIVIKLSPTSLFSVERVRISAKVEGLNPVVEEQPAITESEPNKKTVTAITLTSVSQSEPTLHSLSINHQAASSPPASKKASTSEWIKKVLRQVDKVVYGLGEFTDQNKRVLFISGIAIGVLDLLAVNYLGPKALDMKFSVGNVSVTVIAIPLFVSIYSTTWFASLAFLDAAGHAYNVIKSQRQ